MDWIRIASRTAGLLVILYVATVLELTCPANDFTPSWIALAATLAISVSPPSAGILWAAIGGFTIDATVRGPFGAFLIAYGIVTGMLVSLVPAGRRLWWFTPAMAFLLAAVLPVVPAVISRVEGGRVVESPSLLTMSLIRGCATAFAATLCVMMHAVLQRLLTPRTSTQPMQLANRWTMLTE